VLAAQGASHAGADVRRWRNRVASGSELQLPEDVVGRGGGVLPDAHLEDAESGLQHFGDRRVLYYEW
jgi:hypothetical protein